MVPDVAGAGSGGPRAAPRCAPPPPSPWLHAPLLPGLCSPPGDLRWGASPDPDTDTWRDQAAPGASPEDYQLSVLAHTMAARCAPSPGGGLRRVRLEVADAWLWRARGPLQPRSPQPEAFCFSGPGPGTPASWAGCSSAAGSASSLPPGLPTPLALGGAPAALPPPPSPARLPGPQVQVLPPAEAEAMAVDSFEQLWPPGRSPEDMVLCQLAVFMEARAWPPGVAGALALPVAQAGMVIGELWKSRQLHRACAAKPLTTALLRGAAPHVLIRPRTNAAASGDALVVLHVRRRGGGGGGPTAAAAACSQAGTPAGTPSVPPGGTCPHATRAVADAAAAAVVADPVLRTHAAAAIAPLLAGGHLGAEGDSSGWPGGGDVDCEALEAGIDYTWLAGRSASGLLKACLARVILRRALTAGGAPCISAELAGAVIRALLQAGAVPAAAPLLLQGSVVDAACALVAGDALFETRPAAGAAAAPGSGGKALWGCHGVDGASGLAVWLRAPC